MKLNIRQAWPKHPQPVAHVAVKDTIIEIEILVKYSALQLLEQQPLRGAHQKNLSLSNSCRLLIRAFQTSE